MLKKENRIKTRREMEEIKREGYFLPGKRMGLLVGKAQEEGVKFGLIVSKKVSKKAVERNRGRRLAAGAILANKDKWREGWRLVFLAKRSFIDLKEAEAVKEIRELMEKVGEKNCVKNN